MGIGPADVNRMVFQDALMALGQHRHPDYWQPDHELAPIETDRRKAGRHEVASPRDRKADGQQAIDQAHRRNAERVAAARAGLPEPAWRDGSPGRGAADVVLQVGVTGGDKR